MGFLVTFVVAVVIVGAIVIAFNVRMIRKEGGPGGVSETSPLPPQPPLDRQPAASPGPPVMEDSVRGAEVTVEETAVSSPSPDLQHRRLTDDEYRAALRILAENRNLPTPRDTGQSQSDTSEDDAYRAGLRSLSRRQPETEQHEP